MDNALRIKLVEILYFVIPFYMRVNMFLKEVDNELYNYLCSIKSYNVYKKIELIFKKRGALDIYAHSELVAKNCTKIAKQYGLCEEKCMIASYCHDISQVIAPNEMINYFERKNLFLDNSEKKYPFLLHQRCSSIFAYENLEINDLSILTAIGCHTTLKSNPSEYDLALFIADKLSWEITEKEFFCNEVVEGLEKSLYHAAYAYINYMIKSNKMVERHAWLEEAIEWLEKKICSL